MGLFTIGFYIFQLAFGFFVFLVLLLMEGLTAKCRAHLVPVHSTLGLIAFIMAVSTCIQGINEKCIENFAWRYPEWPPEAALMNILGLLLVAAGLVMSYLLLRTDFRYCGRIQIMFKQNPLEIFVQYVRV
ncbi:plasma membrane ascorbate-dependent reductase CYBRD1 isoform X2 [Anabrus simplex]|uniref:plasma membrane ascorbate-dependent reductase CYBRD1 isoform X2 n=1 Tax=Anabrus simplex TaxID=316456 RepID=UPI0034DD64FF